MLYLKSLAFYNKNIKLYMKLSASVYILYIDVIYINIVL